MIFNVPITGRIKNFDGEIRLNEKQPERSLAIIKIDTGSVDTMNPDTDNFIRSIPMLHSAKFPSATLRTEAFNPLNLENLIVGGDLTIKGIKRNVSIPFRYQHGPDKNPNKRRVIADGEFEFSRFDFDIGVDSWSNDVLFKETLSIEVHLEMICADSEP